MSDPFSAAIKGAFDIAGGLIDKRAARKAADKNAALQREFAQTGIQWKVADARKAGLHPLYALGASTATATPVYSGGDLGQRLADAGQDITNAALANQTTQEKADLGAFALARERAQLQNDLLRSQIAEQDLTTDLRRLQFARAAMEGRKPDAAPVAGGSPAGQANTGVFNIKPAEVTASRKADPSTTAGPAAPFRTEYTTREGFKYTLPAAQDIGEAMENVPGAVAGLGLFGRQFYEDFGIGDALISWYDAIRHFRPSGRPYVSSRDRAARQRELARYRNRGGR